MAVFAENVYQIGKPVFDTIRGWLGQCRRLGRLGLGTDRSTA